MSLQAFQAVGDSEDALNAAGVLLRGLIDYAGLFPPASLTMTAAAANYDAYLWSEEKWILGRFILPVSRLDEFEEAFGGLPMAKGRIGFEKWQLSVIPGSDVAQDIARIRKFNARMPSVSAGTEAVVESVEVKVAGAEEIKRLAEIIPPELTTYFEIPLSDGSECIRAVAGSGRRAKIRMGGETADKFPAPRSVIEFVRRCAAAKLPFKATAGLHHPLRSLHPFTYQRESPSGMMHGFLNVFLAAAFLRSGMETEIAVQLLEEESAQAFHFDRDAVSWRQYRLQRDEIAAARQAFAISFGSCSFREPIDDLRLLRLL